MQMSMKKLYGTVIGTTLALAAAMTSLAAKKETADVTIPNVRGGIIEAKYEESGKIIYLPIGETTTVPKGTKLQYSVKAFEPGIDSSYVGLISSLEINDEKIWVDGIDDHSDEIVVNEDTEFHVVFKAIDDETYKGIDILTLDNLSKCYLRFIDVEETCIRQKETGIFNSLDAEEEIPVRIAIVTRQFSEVSLDDDPIGNHSFKITDVKYRSYSNTSFSSSMKELDDNFFTISDNGNFGATEKLEEGRYSFKVICRIGDAGSRDYIELSENLTLEVGRKIKFKSNFGKYWWGEDDAYTYLSNYVITPITASDSDVKTFDEIVGERIDNKIMMGKHEPVDVGKYSYENGEFTSFKDEIIEDLMEADDPVVAVDIKFEDYEPVLIELLTEDDFIDEFVSFTGWYYDDENEKVYFYRTADPESMLKEELLECDENLYYFGTDGSLAVNTTITVNGVKYSAGEDGVLTKIGGADSNENEGTGSDKNEGTGSDKNEGTGSDKNEGTGSGESSGSGSRDDSGSSYSSSFSNNSSTTANSTGSTPPENGSWVQNGGTWSFKLEDGTIPVKRWARITWGNNNQWFYFDANGQMKTGWILSNGKWYYLHPQSDGMQGCMHTGWNQINGQWFYMDPVDGDTMGAVLTGWRLINDKWYYFSTVKDSTEGMMYSNTTTPDGYRVGADGAWIQ